MQFRHRNSGRNRPLDQIGGGRVPASAIGFNARLMQGHSMGGDALQPGAVG